jgi:hypothetical protein
MNTYGGGLDFSIFGEPTGCIYGNVLAGIVTKVDSAGGTGYVRLYLKPGSGLWIDAQVTSKPGGQDIFRYDYIMFS